MANDLTNNPLIFDTVGGYFDGRRVGNIKSIVFSGNTDTDSTILLYNAKNLIRANDFQNWNADTSAPPLGWKLSGANATIARESTIVPTALQTQNMAGSYSAKLTRAGADCKIEQNVLSHLSPPQNDITWWRGRKFIAGAWVYATVASRVYIETYDGTTTGTAVAHSGGSTWEFVKVAEHTVNAAAVELTIRLIVKTGDTSGYFTLPIAFETRQLFYLLGADKPITHVYGGSGMPFDGLYLQTLTGGAVQVQI